MGERLIHTKRKSLVAAATEIVDKTVERRSVKAIREANKMARRGTVPTEEGVRAVGDANLWIAFIVNGKGMKGRSFYPVGIEGTEDEDGIPREVSVVAPSKRTRWR